MSALGYRAAREPLLLLQDSVFRVRQLVQTLSPSASDALRADPYTTPVAAGVDRETEYVYCAAPARCFVWRSNSPNPTCYEFRAGGDDGRNREIALR